MPNLKILRNITERFKKLANFVNVFAGADGQLMLNAETSMAAVTTHFRNLQVFNVKGNVLVIELEKRECVVAKKLTCKTSKSPLSLF